MSAGVCGKGIAEKPSTAQVPQAETHRVGVFELSVVANGETLPPHARQWDADRPR
jgi:hypothetical protein